MALADQIRSRRLARDLSLAELARQAKISKAYLHQLESNLNGHRPSAEILYRVAFALGTSVGELLEKDLPPGPDRSPELTDVPESLRAFAVEAGLEDADIKMLACIEYRGRRPQTKED